MSLLKKKAKPEPAETAVPTEVPTENKPTVLSGSVFQSVIRRPHVSEKTARTEVNRQYAFEVHPDANKSVVREEVEHLYRVTVERVNIVRLKGKPKRWGSHAGSQSPRKKAIVTLKAGQKIDTI